MMFANRLTAALAGLAVVLAGLTFAPSGTADARPPRPAAPPPAAATTSQPTRLLAWRTGHPTLYSPDGKEAKELTLPAEFVGRRGRAILSPDGRQMAYAGFAGSVLKSGNSEYSFHSLWVRPVGDNGPGKTLAVHEGQPTVWSRDGKRLYGFGLDEEAVKAGKLQIANWVCDIPAGTCTVLDVPKTFRVADESPDGKHLLAVETGVADGTAFTRTHLLGRDGRRETVLVEKGEPYTPVRFSPDGKRVLLVCQQFVPAHQFETENTFAIYDIPAKKLTKFKPEGLPRYHQVEPPAACWSPDGTKIAFAWMGLPDQNLQPKPARPAVPPPGNNPPPVVPAAPTKPPFPWTLSVMDADGKNVRELATDKERAFQSIDWK